jgi:hypothetical protein
MKDSNFAQLGLASGLWWLAYRAGRAMLCPKRPHPESVAMSDLIDAYTRSLKAVDAADQEATAEVEKILQTADALGATGGRGGLPSTWKELLVPTSYQQTIQRSQYLKVVALPELPSKAELTARIGAYWHAIDICDRAYEAIPKGDRRGLTPPPGYSADR